MGLYDTKGLEEIKFKIEGFLDSFKTKTGQDFNPDDLKSLIDELYREKIKHHLKLAFESETMPTIALMRNKWEDIINEVMGNNQEPQPIIEHQLTAIEIKPMARRGRKPKNALE